MAGAAARTTVAAPAEVVDSAAWAGAAPAVSVVVSTFDRAPLLGDLLDRLARQELAPGAFEVVVVDNGSRDATWDGLRTAATATGLPLRAARLDRNRGPGGGRNAGVALARAPIVAFTDDDCLPSAGWLAGVLDAFASGDVEVVQGRVEPDPATFAAMGPWDHTIWVGGPTPFFETCNVAYRRDAFDAAGGFDETDPLLHPPSGRAFGEDACLAAAVLARGGRAAFRQDALVHHRCMPATYRRWLAGQRQLRLFPGLVRRAPRLESIFYRRVFLSRTSAAFDLALAGAALAVAARRPALALAALPWLRIRWRDARATSAGPSAAMGVLARHAASDLVALASLVEGSARHRRLLL